MSLASFRPAIIVPRDPQCLLPWVCPIISALLKKKKKKNSQGPDNPRTGGKKKKTGTGQPQDRKKKKTARDRTTLRPKKKILYREPVSLIFSYCDSLGDCAALSLALQATLSLRREPLFFFFRPLPAAILDLSAASSIGSLVGSLSTAHCCSPPPTLVVGWLCGQMVDLLGSPWALLVFFSRRSASEGHVLGPLLLDLA